CQDSPELDVLVGGASITNNSLVDMGITTNGVNVYKTVTLTNSGTTNLLITGLSITPSLYYSISPAVISFLATNASTNLVVTFNSTSNAAFSGILSVTSNEADNGDGVENPFLVNLLARANPT